MKSYLEVRSLALSLDFTETDFGFSRTIGNVIQDLYTGNDLYLSLYDAQSLENIDYIYFHDLEHLYDYLESKRVNRVPVKKRYRLLYEKECYTEEEFKSYLANILHDSHRFITHD